MDYFKAMEYQAQQKSKTTQLADIVNELWNHGTTVITTGFDEEYQVVYIRKNDLLDIVLSIHGRDIGFVVLKDEGNGKYSIVNDTSINPHPAITSTAGHGLGVHEEFRKKGIGSALLSIAIEIARKDFTEKGEAAEFSVMATDITKLGYGCYHHFGFRLQEGMQVTTGVFSETDRVPEIRILQKKSTKFGRLLKRLGLRTGNG
ncbi:GNAT family N-acetyltransferase [Thermodesulfobacteriota bacterium]